MLRLSVVLLLSALFPADGARAEAIAPAGQHGACLAARIDALPPDGGGQPRYRIVFVNHCESPRNFFWCAENPSAVVPAAVACPGAQGGLGAELRHLIRYRKEFQWHLPAGTRIRYLDCPAQEIPSAGFRCEPPVASIRR